MTTAKVEIWKDVGYTEGCLDAPSQTSSLPSPNATFNGLQISRETLFSQFKVRQAYEDLYDCSYVRMTMDMNNGDDVVLYGWIDKVSCSSDTPSSPVTTIDWHVDYWRSFLSKASFGSGTVTKRPESGTVPPQSYSNMTLLATDNRQSLLSAYGAPSMYWAYCNLTVGTDTKTVTTLCWPVNIALPNGNYHIRFGTVDYGVAPSFNQTMEGAFDEGFGIDPDAIYGCWLSPVPPAPPTISVESLTTYVSMSPWGTYKGTSYTAFKPFTSADVTETDYYPDHTISVTARTTDTSTFIVTDFDGEPTFNLPWGVPVTSCSVRTVNADTSMYLSFRFKTASSELLDAGADSLSCSIPLKSIAMSSNAKSSYVYSGQQEYDREQMNIQRQQALVSSLTGTMTGTTSNVVMAGLGDRRHKTYLADNKPEVMFKEMRGLGMATAGAVTAGAGIAGASIDYLATGYFNDSIMDSTMKYKSAQTSTLTLPGSGADWVHNGRKPMLVEMAWDDYSIQQRQADMDLYGISVNEPMTSCQALIDAGGPLRINNLTVTGKIPVGAKTYFRERFANGVRIV